MEQRGDVVSKELIIRSCSHPLSGEHKSPNPLHHWEPRLFSGPCCLARHKLLLGAPSKALLNLDHVIVLKFLNDFLYSVFKFPQNLTGLPCYHKNSLWNSLIQAGYYVNLHCFCLTGIGVPAQEALVGVFFAEDKLFGFWNLCIYILWLPPSSCEMSMVQLWLCPCILVATDHSTRSPTLMLCTRELCNRLPSLLHCLHRAILCFAGTAVTFPYPVPEQLYW